MPKVCAYQQVEYRVTVFSSNSEVLIQRGPYIQLYANGEIVTLKIEDEVLIDVKIMNITVEFTVEDTNLTVYKVISKLNCRDCDYM